MQQGNRALESGSWALADEWRCAYVLLHRHPLSYSRVDTAFAAILAERGRRVAVWRPEGLADAEPVYDADDGYYLPLADIGPLLQPGPEVEVWRVDEYAEGEVGVQGAREIFAKAYAVWAAVKQHNEGRSDRVGRLLQKSLAMRAADPSIYNDIGIEYRKLRDYQAAIPLWHQAIAAG